MTYSIIALIIGFLLMFAAGCTEKRSAEPGVVDYMTGAEQIKTYKETKSKLEDVNKTLEERYQEVE